MQDKNHYSTAEDLALLLDTALEEPLFYQIFTTHSYTATGSFHPFGSTFTGTLWELPEAESLKNGIILGGKTGYTQEAGLCLASLAEVGGREYLLIHRRCQRGPQHPALSSLRCLDAVREDSNFIKNDDKRKENRKKPKI